MSHGRHLHGGRSGYGPRTGYGSRNFHGGRSVYGGVLGVLLAAIVAGPREDPSSLAELRASDAERDVVVRALSRHLADGRLDTTEFDERLASALTAKTRSELASLLADLPSLAPQTGATPYRHRPALGALAALVITGSVLVAMAGIAFGLL